MTDKNKVFQVFLSRNVLPSALYSLRILHRVAVNYLGLGSETARKLSQRNRWSADVLYQIIQSHDITFAMVYPEWFIYIPTQWCKMADLKTPEVSTASDLVSFDLVDKQQKQNTCDALVRFASILPDEARLTIKGCKA